MRAGVLPAERKPAPAVEPAADAPAAASPAIGGYRQVRQLAASPVTAVWEAVRDGRRYALKSVAPTPAGHFAALRGLLHAEYCRGIGISHPHIVAPVDWIDTDGVAAIVFDYLPGGDLVSLAGFPPRTWTGALLDLFAAIGHLHALGLAHRDIKARNVMFDASDRVRLIDLGSCRPIGAAAARGGTTAGMRAPDTGAVVTADDDNYAFAKLVQEMLTGTVAPAGRPSAPAAMQLYAAADAVIAAPAGRRGEQLRSLAFVLKSMTDTGRSR